MIPNRKSHGIKINNYCIDFIFNDVTYNYNISKKVKFKVSNSMSSYVNFRVYDIIDTQLISGVEASIARPSDNVLDEVERVISDYV